MSDSRSSDADRLRGGGSEGKASRTKPPPARIGVGGRGVGSRVEEHSAGGVVVRFLEGLPHVLLIRDPYRRWGLPKGHLEDGEGAEEAALREVREETGLEDLELGPDLGEIDWTFRKSGILVHKFCRFYLMWSTHSQARPEVSEGITECRWLPVDEALGTIAYDNARAVLARGVGRLGSPRSDG